MKQFLKFPKYEKIVQKINFKMKNSKSEGKKMPKTANRVSLGAVHTHTHPHTHVYLEK